MVEDGVVQDCGQPSSRRHALHMVPSSRLRKPCRDTDHPPGEDPDHRADLSPVFVSHGAPTLVLEDHPARHFLAGWGDLPRPKAILCVSATGKPISRRSRPPSGPRPSTTSMASPSSSTVCAIRRRRARPPRRGGGVAPCRGVPVREASDAGPRPRRRSPDPDLSRGRCARRPGSSISAGKEPDHHLAVGRAPWSRCRTKGSWSSPAAERCTILGNSGWIVATPRTGRSPSRTG